MAFSLVTPLRLSNGSLGASPGGDGGREAGGDRALHRATSAVIGSCLVGLQQLRRHADRVTRIQKRGGCNGAKPQHFSSGGKQKGHPGAWPNDP